MRYFLLLFVLMSISIEPINKKERSMDFYELQVGHILTIEGISYYFESVTSDSRCPKEVMCVQAGEALVNLKISKEDKEISKTMITFTPTVCMPATIYNDEHVTISTVDLLPYPIAGREVDSRDYVLKLSVEKTIHR